jgi:tight adherence protein C
VKSAAAIRPWRGEGAGPQLIPRAYAELLEAAGETSPAAQLFWVIMHVLVVLGGAFAGAWFGLGGEREVAPLIFGAMGAALGWWLPLSWLEGRRAARRGEIMADMPVMLDLLQLSLQGGQSLGAAWSTTAAHMDARDSALAKEMRRVDLEVSLGGAWSTALEAASTRTGVDEFRALGQMLEQTERFGTELARMVAVQCDSLRHSELQDLEERAHEASVKMLFPLTALLLPATLLVIVGPLLLMLFDALRQATSD